MEDKDDGNDWDVKEEEIIDIFDWDDGDAAAAFEEEVAEFQAAASALSDVAMSGASEKTEISSSATIASVSTWFLLVTFPIWYLNWVRWLTWADWPLCWLRIETLFCLKLD